MSVAGLLLAAGRSTRFGAEDKLLAPFRGRLLAEWGISALRAAQVDHRLIAATSEAVAALAPGFVHVQPPLGSGQAESLRAGVLRARALGADRLVVCLADMPFVDADLVDAVIAAAGAAQASAATDGTRRTPPACFPAAMFGRLLVLGGDRGAGPLLAHLPQEALVTVRPDVLSDIDTPDALARYS
ncbi:molybdenum cofactor cytidylyltransferase [Aliiruegeria haliotis]|uniref:Molybdenum cofactor cytidylyltransferase n=1 Tax=Aliiruegeria haliotis TaxID=1280846 RepID=A0A2T0RRZ6_9RHOB|nr:NTP transferase domain-containing protein [Aliiruegeria haliotis]PRY23863.1 molybdenum cofactor cytidylyltransferase [Aliiruegeria haliotis]